MNYIINKSEEERMIDLFKAKFKSEENLCLYYHFKAILEEQKREQDES